MAATIGRKYRDSEVARLSLRTQPTPLMPYDLRARTLTPGMGHKRRSGNGTRWCPYCQTPLRERQRACDICQPLRADITRNGDYLDDDDQEYVGSRAPGVTTIHLKHLGALLRAVDALSTEVGRASAQLNRGDLFDSGVLHDWFMVSKYVEVTAQELRQRIERQ